MSTFNKLLPGIICGGDKKRARTGKGSGNREPVSDSEPEELDSYRPGLPETMSEIPISTKFDGESVLVTVESPLLGQLTPTSICCVVDVSGSMGSEATIQNEAGVKEGFGLSVLDVTKHALRTIISSLSSHDKFSLVTFSHNSEIVMRPTLMNKKNQDSAIKQVMDLQPTSSTNLWAGLKDGMSVLRKDGERFSSVFLLTDGQPNQSPKEGEVEALRTYLKDSNCSAAQIHTFGFGYNMNSQMLRDLATLGGGNYGFIPDSSFVGTVFVNAVANQLLTVRTNLTMSVQLSGATLKDGPYKQYKGTFLENSAFIEIGTLRQGQSKEIVFPVNGQSLDSKLTVTVEEKTDKNKVVTEVVDWTVAENDPDIEYHTRRLELVAALSRVSSAKSQVEFRNASKIIDETIHSFEEKVGDNSEQRTKDLLEDLRGQLKEAFESTENHNKWGRHFTLSIMGAHLEQYCNNFKDPGVQHYGGQLFSETRDRLDETFVKLPPPEPSIKRVDPRTGRQKQVNMAMFMNACGGCFHPNSRVSLPNREVKTMTQLRKGDQVLNGSGRYDRVECVLRTWMPDKEPIEFSLAPNQLLLTPWHPIRVEDSDCWHFPSELYQSVFLPVGCVYTVVLEERSTILVNEVECATLGHGLAQEVVEHPFLGTERVVDALRRLDGWSNGTVDIGQDWFVRGSDGKICDIRAPLDNW